MKETGGIYFAPMEGITGHIYRKAHAKHFSGIDRYYLPFIAAHATHNMKNKEKKDISPANNVGLSAVPQVLTKNVDDFLWVADELMTLGYHEINLNFGCPSPTVTSKGKGAAFLGTPDEMERFLDGIFEAMARKGILADSRSAAEAGGTSRDSICVSVKTRIGVEETSEWERIFAVYNRYPISELVVHARTLREFYNGGAHPEIFDEILEMSRIPVCYNGNVFTEEDYRDLTGRFGKSGLFSGIMIGRGLIRNPALVQEIRGGERLCAENLLAFHDEVLVGYCGQLSGDTHVISKMKELWWYMGRMFADADRPLKRLRKSRTVTEYRAAVREVLRCRVITTDREF